jgi:hypothetical protein
LVVSVEGIEGNSDSLFAGFPVRTLPHKPMGDLTERAMRAAESCAYPVSKLAAQGAIRVIHAY